MFQLVVISGGSAVGKGVVVKELCSRYSEVIPSVSATDRLPRPGEQEGVSYYFLSKNEFQKKMNNNEFLEVSLGKHSYATPISELHKLKEGMCLVLDVDIGGGKFLKERYGDDVCLIFLLAPSAEEQERRLRNRKDNTITEEEIQFRLKRTSDEVAAAEQFYDHVLVNETVSQTVDQIWRIIQNG